MASRRYHQERKRIKQEYLAVPVAHLLLPTSNLLLPLTIYPTLIHTVSCECDDQRKTSPIKTALCLLSLFDEH